MLSLAAGVASSDRQVVLIDGSEARLSEETKSVPMTLFQISGKPFIEHLSRYPVLNTFCSCQVIGQDKR